MKKVNVWLIVAVLLAVVVNPDESHPYWLFVLWGNVVFALVCKSIIYANRNANKDANGSSHD